MAPNQWIGVEACWHLYSDEPWKHFASVTPDQLASHTYIIGATGSGKTVLIHHLVAQDLERGHSICVLDLRGDLVSAVLELCAGRVNPAKVKVIDLREKERAFGFNPLSGPGEPYFRALSVLDVIASESESWGVQLAETLRNGLLLLAESAGSLTDLESLLFDSGFRISLLIRSKDEPLLGFWRRFDQLSPDRQMALATPVLNKVSALLATQTLRRILGHQEPVDLGTHLNTKGSVLLVSLAVDELHASGRMMGSLILSAICREIFSRVHILESERNGVRLYVDEFEHFGLKEFDSILVEGRKFGLSAVIAHQSLAQLSPKLRAQILGNVGMKFVFRLGYDDGQALGKDIFRDPKFYNFTELPVGYCVMWQKDSGDIEIEVNEPLIANVGQLSSEGRAFVRAVYDHAPRFIERTHPEAIQTESPPPPTPPQTPTKQPRRNSKPPSLEDWL